MPRYLVEAYTFGDEWPLSAGGLVAERKVTADTKDEAVVEAVRYCNVLSLKHGVELSAIELPDNPPREYEAKYEKPGATGLTVWRRKLMRERIFSKD